MLQERLYIPFKWALFLSFADVMSFFISVYLLLGVSENCLSILFLLLKRTEIFVFFFWPTRIIYEITWFFQVVKMGLCEKEALFRRENVKIDNIWTEKEEYTLLLFKILLLNTILSVILCLLSRNIAANNKKGCMHTTILKTFYIFAVCDNKIGSIWNTLI